jgi:hypothetical protein
MPVLQFSKFTVSFDYSWFLAKNLSNFLPPPPPPLLENSTAGIAIIQALLQNGNHAVAIHCLAKWFLMHIMIIIDEIEPP